MNNVSKDGFLAKISVETFPFLKFLINHLFLSEKTIVNIRLQLLLNPFSNTKKIRTAFSKKDEFYSWIENCSILDQDCDNGKIDYVVKT